MSNKKIMTILDNYKTLTSDISKIEKKTKFLREKKKKLENVLINYFNKNKIDKISNITVVSNIRRESLSKKYLDNVLRKYYRNYFLSNQSKLSNNDITKFSDRKTKALLNYILKNRSSQKYYRLKIN